MQKTDAPVEADLPADTASTLVGAESLAETDAPVRPIHWHDALVGKRIRLALTEALALDSPHPYFDALVEADSPALTEALVDGTALRNRCTRRRRFTRTY